MAVEDRDVDVDLSDLPDHPNDRVTPGFEPESREELRKLVEEADGIVGSRFHGLTVVATTKFGLEAMDPDEVPSREGV